MRVDRFTLAKAFNVHPGSVAVWLREGLSVALVEPGAPGRPALFDGAVALAWLNGRKKYHRRTPCTLADLRAMVRQDNATTTRRAK